VTEPVDPSDLFAALGEEKFTRLVGAFYAQVPGDDVLGPMYPPHDLAGAEQRLREFLIYRCGGPPRYLQARGHPRLRMRHAPFSIDQRARDRWLQLMNAAMDEVGLAGDTRARLHAFLADVATFLINRAGNTP
jgi:hemoglobin